MTTNTGTDAVTGELLHTVGGHVNLGSNAGNHLGSFSKQNKTKPRNSHMIQLSDS